MAELTAANIQRIEINAQGKVTKLVYTNGKTCTYTTGTAPEGAIETDGNYYVTNAAAKTTGGSTGGTDAGTGK